MKILNFSPDAILDAELKPVGSSYQNYRTHRGFVFQWHQSPVPSPRLSANARNLMRDTFFGRFSSLRTYSVGSGWQCTETSSLSGKPNGVIFYMQLDDSNTATVEAFVRNMRSSSPLSVLTSFAFGMTPQISVVPQVNGTTKLISIIPSDRGIVLDVSSDYTPDGIFVDWKNGNYIVPDNIAEEHTVIGRAALTLAGLREQ